MYHVKGTNTFVMWSPLCKAFAEALPWHFINRFDGFYYVKGKCSISSNNFIRCSLAIISYTVIKKPRMFTINPHILDVTLSCTGRVYGRLVRCRFVKPVTGIIMQKSENTLPSYFPRLSTNSLFECSVRELTQMNAFQIFFLSNDVSKLGLRSTMWLQAPVTHPYSG